MSNEQRPPLGPRPFDPSDLEGVRESDLALEDEKTAPISAPSARPLVAPLPSNPAAASVRSSAPRPAPRSKPAKPSRQPFEPLGVVPRMLDADVELDPRIEAAPYVPRGRSNAAEAGTTSEASGVRHQSGARAPAPTRAPAGTSPEPGAPSEPGPPGPARGPFGIPERTSAPPPPPVEPFMYLIPGRMGAARAEALRATPRGMMSPVETPRAERAHFGSDEPARAVPRVQSVRPGQPVDLPPRAEPTPRSGSTTVLQAYFEPTVRTERSQTFEDRAPADHAWLPRYRPHFYYVVASSVAAALAVLVLASLRTEVPDAGATKKSASAPVEMRTNASLPATALPPPSGGSRARRDGARPASPETVSVAAAASAVAEQAVEQGRPVAQPAREHALVATPEPARDLGRPSAPPAAASPPSLLERASSVPSRGQADGSPRRPRTLDGVDIETPLISD